MMNLRLYYLLGTRGEEGEGVQEEIIKNSFF